MANLPRSTARLHAEPVIRIEAVSDAIVDVIAAVGVLSQHVCSLEVIVSEEYLGAIWTFKNGPVLA